MTFQPRLVRLGGNDLNELTKEQTMKKTVKLSIVLMVTFIACVFNSSAGEGDGGKKGKIESGKPRYLVKKHDAWNSKGRIVGISKQTQPFKITILNSAKKHVKAAEVEIQKDGKIVYEVWLKPGTYIMLISAKGYETLDLKNLIVKKGHDLRIDLEFTKKEN